MRPIFLLPITCCKCNTELCSVLVLTERSSVLHLCMANTSKGNQAPWSPFVLIAILLVALFLVKNYLKNPEGPARNDTHKVVVDNNNVVPNNDNGLIRNPT